MKTSERRRFMNYHIAFAMFLLITANDARLYGQNENNSSAEFPPEASASWEKLQDEYSKGFTATVEYADNDNGPATAVIKVRDDMELTLSYNQINTNVSEDKQADFVYAKNPKYSFKLKKEAEKWSMFDLSRRNAGSEEIVYSRFFKDLYGGVMFIEYRLVDFIKSPYLEIRSLEDVVIDGDNYVKMNFCYSENENNNEFEITGDIVFDPASMWIVKQARAQITGKKQKESLTLNIDCSYQLIDGIPFIKEYERSLSLNDASNTTIEKESVQVKSLQRDSISKKCFFLSDYGFPEPAFTTSGGKYVKIVLLFIGALLFFLGLYLRKQTKITPEPNGK